MGNCCFGSSEEPKKESKSAKERGTEIKEIELKTVTTASNIKTRSTKSSEKSYNPDNDLNRYPWREFDINGGWNHEYAERLRQAICKRKRTRIQPRVLLLGLPGAGKSSFVNTLATIDQKHISSPARAGVARTGRLTTALRPFFNINLEFTIVDTMGLSNETGCHMDNIKYIIGGNIKANYKCVPGKPISENDLFFDKTPTLANRVHCVVTVVEGKSIETSSTGEDILKYLYNLQAYLHDTNVPNVIVVTKIDKSDVNVEADIKHVYNSSIISTIVKKATQDFEVQEMDVFPVKNYTCEIDLKDDINILHLLALRRILGQADDFIRTKEESERHAKNLPL